MKTRVGKIARLPQSIREELNQRLADGEQGKHLIAWLNGLPEVQKMVAEQFNGQRVREQNLSEWKKGGFVDWQRHQELRRRARCIVEQSDDLGNDEGPVDLSESLAFLVVGELMIHAQELSEISNPKERWRKFRQIARELSRIRRDDQRFRRTELYRQQWESTLEPLEEDSNAESGAENAKTNPENPAQNSPPGQVAQEDIRPDPT